MLCHDELLACTVYGWFYDRVFKYTDMGVVWRARDSMANQNLGYTIGGKFVHLLPALNERAFLFPIPVLSYCVSCK